jgi:hypothetical protein
MLHCNMAAAEGGLRTRAPQISWPRSQSKATHSTLSRCSHGEVDPDERISLPMVNFFIQRPIFTSAIATIMVLAGATTSCCQLRSFRASRRRRSSSAHSIPARARRSWPIRCDAARAADQWRAGG